MKYGHILSDAWSLARDAYKLKWFAFFPSFAAVMIFVVEIAWQGYLYTDTFDIEFVNIGMEEVRGAFSFLSDYNLVTTLILLIVLVLLFGMVLPAWVQGTLLAGVREKINNRGEKISIRKCMLEGMDHFFELFEMHAVLGIFSLTSVGLFTATFYRYYHDSLFDFAWPFLIAYAVFSLIVTVFTFFAPHFIVLEEESFQTAIKRSIGFVFLHIGETIAMVLLMILIHFRIVLHVVLIFLVPMGVALIWGSFDTVWINWAAGILGGGLLILSSYLAAVLDVFATTVWTHTFLRLRDAE